MNEWSQSVTVFGMVIVFIGLILLIYSIVLLSKLLKSVEKNSGNQGSPEPAIHISAFGEPEDARDGELIAVITAALMACEQSGKRLVVRSVRRTSAWSDAGRREQLDY